MKKLGIQLLLELHGLQHTVDYLKLIYKESGNLVLFKYRQIEADWTKKELLDCRGIILDRSNFWSVVAFPYSKFFNIGEGYCADIDWNTAKIYEKLDGSLINLYWYNNQWNVQTSGTIDGNVFSNNAISTFESLVWKTVEIMYGSKEEFISRLDTENNYMFELCTPENIVVTPHKDYVMKLHGVRNMKTFQFQDIEKFNLVIAKSYPLKSIKDMTDSFDSMPWTEEGYVVCDANFNRGKIKNPKYVAVHHVSTGVSPYSIMSVIKTNEIDEFLAYFAHRKDEVMFLKEGWDKCVKELTDYYNTIKHIETDKEFALTIQNEKNLKRDFRSIMFNLRNKNISVHDAMCNLHNGNHGFWFNYLHGK